MNRRQFVVGAASAVVTAAMLPALRDNIPVKLSDGYFNLRGWTGHDGCEWVFRLPIEQPFIVNNDTVTAST